MNAVRKAVGIEKKQTVTDQPGRVLPEAQLQPTVNRLRPSMSITPSQTGSLAATERVHGDLEPFVIYFTFGNLCAIASCFFLSGPKSHCKKIIDPTRRIATAATITIFTFFVVFYEKILTTDGGIIILCVCAVGARGVLARHPSSPSARHGLPR